MSNEIYDTRANAIITTQGLVALGLLAIVAASGCGSADLPEDFENDAEAWDVDDVDPAMSDDLSIGQAQSGLSEQFCGQSICSEGPALPAGCDPCVASICAVDSFCCTGAWDDQCVEKVASICGQGPSALASDTLIRAAQLTITTGNDDLRGGSRALGSFQLANGASLPQTSLNNGQGYAGGSVNVSTIFFSPARPRSELVGFTLEWDGAPRNLFDTYDNWNIDAFEIAFEPFGSCPTRVGSLEPNRMTGENTFASTSLVVGR